MSVDSNKTLVASNEVKAHLKEWLFPCINIKRKRKRIPKLADVKRDK